MRSIRLITDFPIKKYDKLISINNAFRSKINTVINSGSLKLSLESILSFFFFSHQKFMTSFIQVNKRRLKINKFYKYNFNISSEFDLSRLNRL